jgi:hypothetical protein
VVGSDSLERFPLTEEVVLESEGGLLKPPFSPPCSPDFTGPPPRPRPDFLATAGFREAKPAIRVGLVIGVGDTGVAGVECAGGGIADTGELPLSRVVDIAPRRLEVTGGGVVGATLLLVFNSPLPPILESDEDNGRLGVELGIKGWWVRVGVPKAIDDVAIWGWEDALSPRDDRL